ncbi:MAG TPA: replication factor C large subunit [Thermoplasmata archaeon]
MQEEWTEKYRPKSLSEIVGNDVAVRTLKNWGESWKNETPRFKALVLRGEPGTGKTSAALALARDQDWDVIEMNASDQRNASSIRSVAGMGSSSETFSPNGEYLSTAKGRRKLIVLDEADNLFGREDYGGAKAIVETIRDSSQPIIVIVNDYYELTRKAPSIKSMAEKAIFRRLDPKKIVSVLSSIAHAEMVDADSRALDRIAQNSGGDLRAAINDLQMMLEGREKVGLEDASVLGKRNQLVEIEAALRAMFGASTLRAARDSTFDIDHTPDELAKWIEENIPLEMSDPADMDMAFDSLSKSDVYLNRTRRLQHYGLWAYAKELMTGGVALSRKHGPRPNVYEYRFPGSFIVGSRARGPRAAREALAGKLSTHFHISSKCFSNSVFPYLSAIVRNDLHLASKLVDSFELDESDLGLLLGMEPSSPEIARLMNKAREGKAAGSEPDRKSKVKDKAGKRGRSLAGY